MIALKNNLLFPVIAALISCYCVSSLYDLHTDNATDYFSTLSSLPEPVAKTITFEFSGLASDYLMLETLTLLGTKLINKEQLSENEWKSVYLSLKQCVNLDKRFFDPYLVAQMTLPFETDMLDETISLLKKAADVLSDDYRPHFFLWYNYFYFLNDPKTAGEHLAKASRIKGAPSYLATLTARMQLYSGKIQAAIIFLEQTRLETNDPEILKYVEDRIDAFKKLYFLEQKISQYKEEYKKSPSNLEELIDKGLLTSIPADPFGGKFYIMPNGRVYSTSKLVYPKYGQSNSQ